MLIHETAVTQGNPPASADQPRRLTAGKGRRDQMMSRPLELEWGPTVTVELSNTYADGHTSTRLITLPAPHDDIPQGDIEQWWEDVVWPETGDGHQGDAHYSARIVRADHEPGLLTLSREWVG